MVLFEGYLLKHVSENDAIVVHLSKGPRSLDVAEFAIQDLNLGIYLGRTCSLGIVVKTTRPNGYIAVGVTPPSSQVDHRPTITFGPPNTGLHPWNTSLETSKHMPRDARALVLGR